MRDDDWISISEILDDIEQILLQAGDPGAGRLARLCAGGEKADRAQFVATLASGDVWNHMGSFFDRSLEDRALDRRFRHAQIRLADALEAAGAATPDVRSWATVLRSWESQGI